ncbi:hypothetical protein U1Q18_026166, partial [Sarracenia purpurea var. burkii]
RKDIDSVAKSPISGNHFAPLREDTNIQGENETEGHELKLADIENPMEDSESEQDPSSP